MYEPLIGVQYIKLKLVKRPMQHKRNYVLLANVCISAEL